MERNPKIHFAYIPSETIRQHIQELETRWSLTIPIQNTQKLHCIKPCSDYMLLVGEVLVSDGNLTEVKIMENPEDDLRNDSPSSANQTSKAKKN